MARLIVLWLAAMSAAGTTQAQGPPDWQWQIPGHTGSVYSVAFSPDGRTLASGSLDRTVRLWDSQTGALLRTLTGHRDYVYSVAFSPDGRTLASGSEDDTIRIWDAETGALLRTLTGQGWGIQSVAFSPAGDTLASGSSDATIWLWDAQTWALLRTLTGHTATAQSVAYSPDGRTIASGSGDRTVRLWDAQTGALLRTLTGHTDWVNSVAFSPDGRTLASGSMDATIRLWDAQAGRLLQIHDEQLGSTGSVAFSPSGSLLANGASASGVAVVQSEPAIVLPTSYAATRGIEQGGNDVAKIQRNDDVFAVVQQRFQFSPTLPNAELRAVLEIPVGNPLTRAVVQVRNRSSSLPVDSPSSKQEIALRDWTAGTFEVVNLGKPQNPYGDEPAYTIALDAADRSRFIRADGRMEVAVRVYHLAPLSSGWTVSVDQISVGTAR